MTVATHSRTFKEVIIKVCVLWCMFTVTCINKLKYLSETADNLDGLSLKLLDCGFRGCSSLEVSKETMLIIAIPFYECV